MDLDASSKKLTLLGKLIGFVKELERKGSPEQGWRYEIDLDSPEFARLIEGVYDHPEEAIPALEQHLPTFVRVEMHQTRGVKRRGNVFVIQAEDALRVMPKDSPVKKVESPPSEPPPSSEERTFVRVEVLESDQPDKMVVRLEDGTVREFDVL